ncbi:hypothetical protein BC629DRAFT_1486393 [Irpex lacteus]|nr:hypothetical protein BC629DRAFT_1486393 [Irpex lacteus]
MADQRPTSPYFQHAPQHPHHPHHHPHHDDHRRGIPPLPDLSFERTYIKSIKRHIHHSDSNILEGDSDHTELVTLHRREAESVRLDWGKVALVTVRDQMLMPFLQGAIWGLTTIYLIPRVNAVRRAFSLWWRRGNLIGVGRKGEGEGVGALRGWISGLTGTVGRVQKPLAASARHAI